MITSSSNKYIKHITKLNEKSSYRKECNLFTIEGIRMFEEAPDDRIELVLVSEEFIDRCDEKIKDKIDNVEHYIVSKELLKAACDTKTPQGIVASISQYRYSIDDIINSDNGMIIILEGLQDPGNVGTIIRAAEGAGVTGIITDDKTADIYNPKVVRSTMGAIFRLPFIRSDDIYKDIDILHIKGIKTYAASLDADIDYDRCDYRSPCAFMIGNEAAGLSDRMIDMADIKISIPMKGHVESLNAAMASTIIIYEAARQRRKS